MPGLASAGGAQPPGHSTAVIPAISTSGLTWQLTATSTPAPLATAWAAATAYSEGAVVKHKERLYRCTTAGTSGTSGPSGVGAGIEDGATLRWLGVEMPVNGLQILNAAAAGGATVFWGFSDVSATVGAAIFAGGGHVEPTVADPTLLYVVTAASTALVTVAGLC